MKNKYKDLIRQLLSLPVFYTKKRDNNLWVFGEWFGERCCDNCLYFANYVAEHHPEIKVVWISLKGTDLRLLNKSIETVVMDTQLAIDYLKRAGYVFFVQSSRDLTHLNKIFYSGSKVINLWHGAPWKKIGIDVVKSNKLKKLFEKLRLKLFGGQYYLAYSDVFERIFSRAYALDKDRIIKAGYPRNQVFYDEKLAAESKKRLLKIIGSRCHSSINSDTRVISYMPTFRNIKGSFSFIAAQKRDEFESLLEKKNAIIVQKGHFAEKNVNYKHDLEYGRVFTIHDVSAQELLASSDILISDYSSCIFDYLISGNPIIYYIYDYDEYNQNDRGLYFDKNDVLAGAEACSEDELLMALSEYLDDKDKDSELREIRKNQYLNYESSDSCNQLFCKLRLL